MGSGCSTAGSGASGLRLTLRRTGEAMSLIIPRDQTSSTRDVTITMMQMEPTSMPEIPIPASTCASSIYVVGVVSNCKVEPANVVSPYSTVVITTDSENPRVK